MSQITLPTTVLAFLAGVMLGGMFMTLVMAVLFAGDESRSA